MTARIKVAVLAPNSFSGQDFVDLLLDQPAFQVLGVSRSAERSQAFCVTKLRKELSAYRYWQLDMNNDMPRILELLDASGRSTSSICGSKRKGRRVGTSEHWFQTNTVAPRVFGQSSAQTKLPQAISAYFVAGGHMAPAWEM